ncbi:sensor histidine kinase [Arthrobacter mobilis]|uniref:histidine kinase n=1 Tax=Arthrobacter mobilis TaxID=2724944 RepID=A0A7X6HFJ4_9MICC|nr:HAMP domain-containing sensor histidine kinase [Arthrobacter mobilis]NKX56224.1 HAMP domain-containing histidine kinase [Arthrobacter mobilis]
MLQVWQSASLRTQLVAIICVLMVATVGMTSLLTITLLRDTMIQRMDDDIRNNAESMSTMLIRAQTGLGPSSTQAGFYGVLMDSAGNILRRSQVEDGDPDTPAIQGMTIQQVLASRGAPFDVPGTSPDSDGWRVRAFELPGGGASVAVARPYAPVNNTVEALAALSLSIGLMSTLAASVIAWAAVTRAFRPLSKVEKTAAAIAAGDLSRRVEVASPATEIGRLSRSLNAMLAHIETAFAARSASEQRMRRFVADASHELRTPLVTIRGFSELYRHGALQSRDDIEAAMGRIEGEAKRMGQLVEDLLTLARADEQRPMESKPLDLLVLGNDAAMDAKASAPDRRISVVGLDGGGPVSAPVVGDEARLRQVMANLVTNALRYTPPGSPIEIATGVVSVIDDRKDSVIEVRDHGPGISGDEAARVFERFYRADSSRHRETGGTGLGLAIVAALVAQHDGTVRLYETEGGGATMSIRIPYQPLPEQQPAPAG